MGKLDKNAVEAYKNELKNLWYYKDIINDLQSKIELIEYEMSGMKGIDYSKESGSHNPSATEHRRLSLIEKYNRLIERKKEYIQKEHSICRVLNAMPEEERNLVIEVIADRRKYQDVCDERKINKSTLHGMINDIIGRALKKAG
jgi:hypothetical protein